jgi:hypothetical protein
VLIIQSDGYVLDGSAWNDEFLAYDYIGAPWLYKDHRNVGNGGFSLRSRRLQNILALDNDITITHPEDEVICRLYRLHLEDKYNIKFAPEQLAHRFSFELHPPQHKTFGFHGEFHEQYQEPIILKRSAAMGDIVMVEPVMEWFYKKGYRVILDVPPVFFNLFHNHHFPVFHISQCVGVDARVINLDMSYETNPRQLVLKSYYETCGITDGEIRNARLNFQVDDKTKMFNRYIVMHIDDTDMEHRNVHGIDWHGISDALTKKGYLIIQVGGSRIMAGVRFNCPTKNMLMYLLAGADYFIGIDSGVGQIAVALGVKSVLFFGSVNPSYRYADLSNINVIQNACPVHKDGCYHSVISVRGKDCEVNKKSPPCITHTTESVINQVNQFIA